MIAVPRDDGGVAVHGSLQCPYYVHKALRRSLLLTDEQAQVIQAETGGGFGGKEEYPSILALHAALLARACGRPVRMIYDRHEDIAATTKRHPAIVSYRSAVSADGRLIGQDIEIVMDGGAYCTLSPVVLSRGTLHSGGPYACPNVRIHSRAVATNTPPNGAFRGFGAPQTEFAAEMQVNRIAEALGESPLELRRRWLYRPGDTTPTGQVLRESVAAEEVLDRGAEAAEFERVRARTASDRAARTADGRSTRARSAHGIGLALAWHGAGFTGSGEVHLASVASVELGADGRIRILIGSTEMGQGTKTIFPQLAAEALGVPMEAVELADVDTALVPDSGPTVASRTAMVVGGLVIEACRRLRAVVEGRSGQGGNAAARSPSSTPPTPGSMAQPGSTSISSRIPGSISTTRPIAAMPTRPSAGPRPWPRSTSISTPARSPSAAWSPPTTSAGSSTRSWPRARSKAARSRPSATPRSRRSSSTTAAT